jgi:hypothetical protein
VWTDNKSARVNGKIIVQRGPCIVQIFFTTPENNEEEQAAKK